MSRAIILVAANMPSHFHSMPNETHLLLFKVPGMILGSTVLEFDVQLTIKPYVRWKLVGILEKKSLKGYTSPLICLTIYVVNLVY